MLDPLRRWLFVFLGLVLLTLPVGAQEKLYRPTLDPKAIEPTLRTDWYGVYLKDQKIGYVRSDRLREGDTIVDQQFTSMKLLSFGKKVEMSSLQRMVFDAEAPYRLRSAEVTQTTGPIEQRTTYTRQGNDYEAVHQVGKEKRVVTLKDIDFTLADAMANEIWIKSQPKVGAQIATRYFDLLDQKMDVQNSKVLASKKSLTGGVEIKLYEVETDSKNKQLTALSRYDDQGNTLSAQIIVFELRREAETQARNFDYSQDLFVMGMVKVDRTVGDPRSLTELVLEVEGKEAEVFQDGPRQRVVVRNGKRLLQIGKKYGQPVQATDEEIRDSLLETNNYPISHPRVKELAEKVVAGATTPKEKVRKIVEYVNDFITPDLVATAPNIHDLLEKKRGDCKSYALMVTNLARAAGIPAREVSGLLYVGDDFKAFGGHAWNEVVLDGVWVPVDASMRETELSASHICFGTETQALRNLLTTLGKLSFRLVEAR